jgi:hypothetical protein
MSAVPVRLALVHCRWQRLRLVLARSVDGGRTWAAVINTTEAWQVSAGATSGRRLPSVFMVGIIQGDSDPACSARTTAGNPSDKPHIVARAPAGNMDE